VPFRVNWGERHGADARRLLALVCRRGGIRGSDVGAIRIGGAQSTFEVAANVAESFTRAVREPDARDPRIHIAPIGGPQRSASHTRHEKAPHLDGKNNKKAHGKAFSPPRRGHVSEG
jgi:hypothetical protein